MKRKWKFRVRREPATSLAKSIHELHEVLMELVQIGTFLLLTGASFGIILVGIVRIRFWLG